MNEKVLADSLEELDNIINSIENFRDFKLNDEIAQQIPENLEEDTNFNMTMLDIDLIRAKEELERAKKQVNSISKILK